MVWNPVALKWEGNETDLRIFDNIVSASFRPALISPMSVPSPGQDSSSPASSVGRAGTTMGLGGVRIVGNMIFDPVKMTWLNQAPEGDEELDFGDDEADALMNDPLDTIKLKPKISFLNFHSSVATSLASSFHVRY